MKNKREVDLPNIYRVIIPKVGLVNMPRSDLSFRSKYSSIAVRMLITSKILRVNCSSTCHDYNVLYYMRNATEYALPNLNRYLAGTTITEEKGLTRMWRARRMSEWRNN